MKECLFSLALVLLLRLILESSWGLGCNPDNRANRKEVPMKAQQTQSSFFVYISASNQLFTSQLIMYYESVARSIAVM